MAVDVNQKVPSQPRISRGWLIRISLSAVMLAVIFWYLPLDAFWESFANVSWATFASVLVLFMLGHGFAACKWWMLLDRGFSFLNALRAHFAGLAANLCLPGVAGGDVVRASLVAKYRDLSELTAASLGDRLIDMMALVLIAAGGVLMLNSGADVSGLVLQAGGLLIFAIAGAFYIFPVVASLVLGKLASFPARGLILKIAKAFEALGKRPAKLITALFMSIAIQCGFVLLFIWLAESAGVAAEPGAWFFAWPMAKIIAVLPISLGGIGLREATLAGLMAPFGAAAAPVVAASLIWQAILFAAGGIGALFWVAFNPSTKINSKHV